MAKSSIYAGLEIGTTKICVVVAEVKRDGAIKILGIGQAPSRGIRKGEIVDMEIAQTCLNDALLRAEDRSDVMIRNVFLGVSGSHVESLNNAGVYRPVSYTHLLETGQTIPALIAMEALRERPWLSFKSSERLVPCVNRLEL